MLLPDVNVLVYAHRRDATDLARYRRIVEEMLASDSAFALSDVVLSGFVRVVTHPEALRRTSGKSLLTDRGRATPYSVTFARKSFRSGYRKIALGGSLVRASSPRTL